MITTPLLENSVNLVIPSSGAANAPVNPAQVQTISIDRLAAIKFNNELVDVETLSVRLTTLKRGESGRGRRHSPRSRTAGAEIDRADGCAAARANHQGRHCDQSRDSLGRDPPREFLAQRGDHRSGARGGALRSGAMERERKEARGYRCCLDGRERGPGERGCHPAGSGDDGDSRADSGATSVGGSPAGRTKPTANQG